MFVCVFHEAEVRFHFLLVMAEKFQASTINGWFSTFLALFQYFQRLVIVIAM